jgi:hypothetical protein
MGGISGESCSGKGDMVEDTGQEDNPTYGTCSSNKDKWSCNSKDPVGQASIPFINLQHLRFQQGQVVVQQQGPSRSSVYHSLII